MKFPRNYSAIRARLSSAALTCAFVQLASADIDRVYHPYVTPLETELEWRGTIVDDSGDSSDREQLHRLAFGRSLSERFFGEAYINARKTETEHLKVSGFEFEGIYQLTEPGEYGFDWGVLAEFERDTDRNISAFGARLLAEKEIGETSLALNAIAEYEYGSGIDNELEFGAAAQWRWRYAEAFEPALEYYVGDGTHGLGPVLIGSQRLGTAKKLKWEFGVIFGASNDTPERTWRGQLEFEF